MKENNYKIYEKHIAERIEKLMNNKFYYEAIFLLSNVLETELKDLVLYHEDACKRVLTKAKIGYKKINSKDLNKLTLGALIIKSEKFISKKTIVADLKKFNKLRIKTVHGLFSANFKKTEQEIVKYIPKFYSLMESILDIYICINANLIKYDRKTIFLEVKNKHKK